MARPVRPLPMLVRCLAWLGIALALGSEGAEAQTRELASAIKATYLYKFAPFVNWPEGSFESPSSPLRICVLGNDAVGHLVEEAAQDPKIAPRPVVVRRLPSIGPDSGCHIAYLAPGSEAPVAATLQRLRGSAVLTVTDDARDARTRGIINFVVRDNRVRFEIDLAAAAEAGFAISSKLLNLAVSVRPPA
ncbi:MAG TPA: YfiR family protein [Casimicrobiaceae bacterium]|nr:YfiR family protein [Casimicrobiaceae bacterium]